MHHFHGHIGDGFVAVLIAGALLIALLRDRPTRPAGRRSTDV
jgi:hypothetical protein